MGTILSTPCSHVLLDQAVLLPKDRDIADHWASKYINNNIAYRWIIGKYVEADRANNNNQMWSLGDLQNRSDTVLHSPMNMLHRANHIVGNFVGAEMMYPVNEMAEEAHPHLEAVGAFWTYYFPTELSVVEAAHNEGSLFFSMECVSETITFIRPDGAEQEFEYQGPKAPEYGEWGDTGNVRRFNGTHFLGGALVVPPARPGWRGAEVKELAELVKENEAEAEAAYETFKEASPHLDAEVWESLMLSVMSRYSE